MGTVPDKVEGGVINRDPAGQPTGECEPRTVRELSFMPCLGVFLDNAQELANVLRPEPTYEQLAMRFNLTVEDAVSHGLTSIHDAGFEPRSLSFFRR